MVRSERLESVVSFGDDLLELVPIVSHDILFPLNHYFRDGHWRHMADLLT